MSQIQGKSISQPITLAVFLKENNFSSSFFPCLFEKVNDQTSESNISQQNKVNENHFIQHEVFFELNSANQKYRKQHNCIYDNCKKAYRSKENLNLHIKNFHFKEKPYQCLYCPARFSHRNGRIYHERKNHTSYLPYTCSFNNCDQSFPCKSAMMAHTKSVHLHMKRSKIEK